MTYDSASEADVREMLEVIGVASVDELFETIPPELRPQSWRLPQGRSEMAVRRAVSRLGATARGGLVCFAGGGYYDHYVPAAVDALSGRSEFYTAYTPYQAECAQGTLQAIYEYQSAICRLTEMEFANASLYDGGTAVFEACAMAMRLTRRKRVVCHESMNPIYRDMLETHTANLGIEIGDGADPDEAACVVVQNPSFLGGLRDFSDLAAACHEAKALLVMSFYPVSLGLVKTPGAMGADIAIAEGQSLGMPLGFGGPYLGIMATRKKHVRRMPGRVGAATQDGQGRRGFVLTMQAREQHIRREKAMSNICSNEALCALRALIHLSLLGKQGFRDLAAQCHSKAEYLKGKLSDFCEPLNTAPTFNEFAVRLPIDAEQALKALLEEDILGGVSLASLGAGERTDLLIAVTEKRTRAELDAFAARLRRVCDDYRMLYH